MATQAPEPLPYRPEIDGLRAVAVLAVLAFHLDLGGHPGSVPGGFAGVDMFFVISGFLITSILLHDLAAGGGGIGQFYRRRALRILPPLVLTVLTVLAVAPLVMLPDELRDTARAALAALGFVANVFFWASFDYFTPEAKDNPLLHLWSLGIEEQFYLVVPLLLGVLYRRARRVMVAAFGACVLLSFGLSLWMTGAMPKAAFYLLPARYWELGTGALLAMAMPRQPLPRLVADLLGLAGAGLAGAGLLLLTPQSAFPGAGALAPVLGTAALIAAGGGSVTGRFLSLPPLRFTGRISYSLYLWHWPLIVLWKLRTGSDLSAAEQAGLGMAALLLATLGTALVETPFRRHTARFGDAAVLAGSAAALAVVAAAAVAVQTAPGMLRTWPPGVLALQRYAGFHASPDFVAWNRRHVCFLSADTAGGVAAFDPALCLGEGDGQGTGPQDAPVVLVLGDSLSAHLWHGLRDALPEYRVVQATASGCRPFPDRPGYAACRDLMRLVFDDWVPHARPSLVVVSARWQAGEEALAADAVGRLLRGGAGRVVVLGPTVEYRGALARILARGLMAGDADAAARRALDPQRRDVSTALQAALAGSGAQYVDMLALLCPDADGAADGGPCTIWIPPRPGEHPGHLPVPLAFDYGHYTPEGAVYVARLLAPLLRQGAGGE